MSKYVIFDEVFPVLFSEAMQHRDFLKLVNPCHKEITSAGMFRVDSNGGVEVYGTSVSLGLSPGKWDANIIGLFLDWDKEV